MDIESDAICQNCGAKIPTGKTCRDLYHELSLYTLSHPDQNYFIHQHIVDAYAAQHINEHSKPIEFAAPLIGLYLFVEHGYSGKEVQKAHMQLGNTMKEWPILKIPEKEGITVSNVLHTVPGKERDAMIKEWAKSVWNLWKLSHIKIRELTNRQLGKIMQP